MQEGLDLRAVELFKQLSADDITRMNEAISPKAKQLDLSLVTSSPRRRGVSRPLWLLLHCRCLCLRPQVSCLHTSLC